MPQSDTCLVVAVQFDELAAHLVSNAARLCRHTGMGLHLVHVIPVSPFAQFNDLGKDLSPFSRLLPPSERSAHEASRRLQELAGHAEGIRVTTNVLTPVDGASSALATEARGRKGVAILCGAGTDSSPLTLKGIATVVALMTHAPLPVMTLNRHHEWSFGNEPFRIMIADDLRADTVGAVTLGIHWAQVLGASVRHIHVNAITPDVLEKALAGAISESRWTRLPQEETVDLHSILTSKLTNRLEERLNTEIETLRLKGGRYETAIVEGDLLERLAVEVRAYRPDLVIFGRHRTMHRDPFELGSLHFKAMLGLDCPLMIAAND